MEPWKPAAERRESCGLNRAPMAAIDTPIGSDGVARDGQGAGGGNELPVRRLLRRLHAALVALAWARSIHQRLIRNRHALRKRLKGRAAEANFGRGSGGLSSPSGSSRAIKGAMALPTDAPVLSPALIASLSRGEVRSWALPGLASHMCRCSMMCR